MDVNFIMDPNEVTKHKKVAKFKVASTSKLFWAYYSPKCLMSRFFI